MGNRVGRNEQCPCGSGKKYKNCCWEKEFRWVRDTDGSIIKEVPISDRLHQALEQHMERKRGEKGSELNPDDPIFSASDMVLYDAEMVRIMKQTNMPRHLVYAYEKTGRLVTAMNKHKLSDKDLEEWQDAVDEYLMLHPEEKPET